MPRVSVIMSVYNNELYLKEAVQSILDQTFDDFEFLIADDCSTDDSLKILRNFEQVDQRVIVIQNEKNIGLTKTLNKLIRLAKGTYIARMDGDDISCGDRFESQMRITQSHPNIDVIFSDIEYIDYKSRRVCKVWTPKTLDHILKLLHVHNYIPHPTVVFKKESIIKYGLYNESYKTGQDLNLWLRIRDKAKFYHLRKVTLLYRLNPNSVSDKQKRDIYFNLANRCIINNNRLKSLKYYKKLTITERIILLLKFLTPFIVYKWTYHKYKAITNL